MRVLIIANPIAGRGRAVTLVRQLEIALQRLGLKAQTHITRCKGDAKNRAANLESDIERLVIAGGDGTVSEVLNGLADPARTPLALLPVGTANILARELALPRQPPAVAQLVHGGRVRRLDMGLVHGRRFLGVVSSGFDAMVVAQIARQRRGSLGFVGYLGPILRTLRDYQPPRLTVTVDGGSPHPAALAVVSNVRTYGGLFSIADQAQCDSGHLDVCLFPRGHLTALARYAWAAWRRRVSGLREVTYLTGRTIRIDSDPPTDVEIDGDHLGLTPVTIEVRPGAMAFLTP